MINQSTNNLLFTQSPSLREGELNMDGSRKRQLAKLILYNRKLQFSNANKRTFKTS